MFEIKTFEMTINNPSTFLTSIYNFFLDKGWKEEQTIFIQDQLVSFSIVKKEMMIKLNLDGSDRTSLPTANWNPSLYCTLYKRTYNALTQTYDLFLLNNKSDYHILKTNSGNYIQKPYETFNSYRIYLFYKENHDIVFCLFFPYNYTKSYSDIMIYQPIIQNCNNKYLNNYIYYKEQISRDSYDSRNIRLDSNYQSLTWGAPIKRSSNLLEEQLLITNAQIHDYQIQTFWGVPLGILSAPGAVLYRFYNINGKKYFCFTEESLICCEDEDDLTPTLPEGAEVIDMAPKPTE